MFARALDMSLAIKTFPTRLLKVTKKANFYNDIYFAHLLGYFNRKMTENGSKMVM